MAQKLSHQLRAAEQRITDLEGEVERHRDRAERAEQRLHKVYTEIEGRFLRQESGRTQTKGAVTHRWPPAQRRSTKRGAKPDGRPRPARRDRTSGRPRRHRAAG
jgi:TolA-binding protein